MAQCILYFVYGLTDPRLRGPSAVRYIGVTTDPNVRYRTHLSCPLGDPKDKNAWIQDVFASSLEPGIEIFEIYSAPKKDRAKAKERETHWIQHFRALGANLLNSHNMEEAFAAIKVGLDEEEVLLRFDSPDVFFDFLAEHPDLALGGPF